MHCFSKTTLEGRIHILLPLLSILPTNFPFWYVKNPAPTPYPVRHPGTAASTMPSCAINLTINSEEPEEVLSHGNNRAAHTVHTMHRALLSSPDQENQMSSLYKCSVLCHALPFLLLPSNKTSFPQRAPFSSWIKVVNCRSREKPDLVWWALKASCLLPAT